MGVISVAGLTTKDLRVTTFVVEVYSDSGLTTLVDSGSAPSVYDTDSGLTKMVGAIRFRALTTGSTYYLRSATVVPQAGPSDWSSTVSMAAGADSTTGVVFGSGPPSGTADEGELYFDTASSFLMYVYHTGAWHSVAGSGGGGGTGGGGGFSSGNNSNGYWVQDPTGHIHQWGVLATDINDGTVAVSFPTAFSSSTGISVDVTTKSLADRISYVVDGSVTASGFTVGNNGSGGYIYWQADGPGVATSAMVLVDPTTTEGDLLYRGSSNLTRLAIGTSGKFLKSNGTDPVWSTLPVLVGDTGSGGTAGLVPAPAAGDAAAGKVLKADGTWYVPGGLSNPMTDQADLIVGGASGVPTRLPIGTSGYVLTSNGPGAAPSWQQAADPGTGFTIPPLTGWTWDVQGSSSVDTSSGSYIKMTAAQYSSGMRMYYRAAPSTPYTITATFSTLFTSGTDIAVDFGFRDASGKYVVLHQAQNGNIYVFKFSASNAPVAAYTSTASALAAAPSLLYLRIKDDGTNLTFYYGVLPFTGAPIVWTTLYTVSRTNYLSSPAYVTWGGYTNGAAITVYLPSWLVS